MAYETTTNSLALDLNAVGVVDSTQQWVLTSMHRHGRGLVNLLWRVLGNEQDVCDAYQQTFLKLAHLPDLKKPRNVKSYLYRTAANEAITMLRRAKVALKSVDVIAANIDMIDNTDFAGDLDMKDMRAKLRSAISCLPEHLRNVVLLRDLAELPYSQVARMLGITSATARVYRSKAVALLAAELS